MRLLAIVILCILRRSLGLLALAAIWGSILTRRSAASGGQRSSECLEDGQVLMDGLGLAVYDLLTRREQAGLDGTALKRAVKSMRRSLGDLLI